MRYDKEGAIIKSMSNYNICILFDFKISLI